jgi:hypothetical protein
MNRLHITLFAVCSLAAIWLSSLPFAGSTSLFLSPDETAVYQSAKAIAQSFLLKGMTFGPTSHLPYPLSLLSVAIINSSVL